MLPLLKVFGHAPNTCHVHFWILLSLLLSFHSVFFGPRVILGTGVQWRSAMGAVLPEQGATVLEIPSLCSGMQHF